MCPRREKVRKRHLEKTEKTLRPGDPDVPGGSTRGAP